MGELSDLIFSILGKLGRYFNIQGKRVCFLIWMVCLGYWFMRNMSLGLKVQSASCLLSMALHSWGYVNWKNKNIGN
jgi:hypothetical protein